jgi:voltage-dependent anion channel protein 2
MSFPQPIPHSWKDLGKPANDLLGKDYYFQGTSLEVKTKTPSGVAFKVTGSRDGKSDAIFGDLEAKWTDKKHGLTVTQAWTTSNILRNIVEVEDQIAQGVKFDLSTSLSPEKGAKTAVLNAAIKQPGFHSRASLDVFKGPTFTADAVVGRDNLYLGAEAAYNVTEGNLTRYATAVAYTTPDYSVIVHALNNLNTYHASYYHRVNENTEAGAKAVYDTKATQGGVALEVGAKTVLDNSAYLKAKINNIGVLALAYNQTLRPGVRATFGLAVDTTKLNDVNPSGPAHKIGLHFVFDS